MQERAAEAVLEELVSRASSLFQRGYSYGSAGNAFLLANHGSLSLGTTLAEACAVAEELEEQARLHFILGARGRRLTSAELQDL